LHRFGGLIGNSEVDIWCGIKKRTTVYGSGILVIGPTSSYDADVGHCEDTLEQSRERRSRSEGRYQIKKYGDHVTSRTLVVCRP
jgi:hypothetical protein